MQEYDRLKEVIASAEEDILKADKGNKAAGTRVRKVMQEVKDAAQEVRKKVLELRDQGEQPQQPPTPPSPSF
jgi:hypothetical protein